MMDYFQKSIRRKFIIVMLVVVTATCLATSVLFYLQYSNKSQHETLTGELVDKRNVLRNIKEEYQTMVFRTRGYIAFNNNNELLQAKQARENLDGYLSEAQGMNWSNGRIELFSDLNLFLEYYWESLIPKVQTAVENGNIEEVRQLSLTNTTEQINEIIQTLEDISNEAQQTLTSENDNFLERMDFISYLLFALMILVVFILSLASRTLSRGIGRPLSELSIASEALAAGRDYDELPSSKRKDEIGTLTRSFQYMAKEIGEREDNLSAQNEELMAQQEMLESYVNDLRNKDLALNESSIVAILDEDGWIQTCNGKLAEASNYSESELEGRHFLSLTEESYDHTDVKKAFPGVEHGKVWKGEVRCNRKGGDFFYTNTTVVPYINEDGKVEQFIVIQKDITDIKQAQQRLKDSLSETEKARSTVEKLNSMNKTLSTTMDKQSLLDKVIYQLSILYPFDHGIFMLLDSGGYAKIGLRKEDLKGDILNSFSHVVQRLRAQRSPYIRERKMTIYEEGYFNESSKSYDLYVPVFNSRNKLEAFFVATRIGASYDKEEINGITSILQRVSLYIERIDSYEQSEINRQLNQDIIDNINEGILFVDEAGRLVQYNQNWLTFLGLPYMEQENWLKVEFEDWLHQISSYITNAESFTAFCGGMVFTDDHPKSSVRIKVGAEEEFRIIEVYAEPIYHQHEKKGILFVFRDITSEFEVNQMKTNLVSTVSHELRTPLASVLGYTELLIHRDLPENRRKKYLNTIHGEAKRLTNLINDFLDLQRMESGKSTFHKEVVELGSLVEEVVENLRITYTDHLLVRTDHTLTSKIHADREKIIQLMNNIIGNAIKFSPDGGEVVVAINNDQSNIYVHVADEGLGIPEHEITKLFTKFHRVDNSSQRKIGGTGLGLAISKEIAEIHNGRISVLSEQGAGSVFSITFPLHEPLKNEDGPVEKVPHVILIEDDINLSQLIKDELGDAGIKVSHYNEGRAALNELDKMQPDVFIIDLTLADQTSGWDIIQAIKTYNHLSDVPIFISSALSQSSGVPDIEVEGYLVKPYPLRKLSTAIMKTLLQESKTGQILIAKEE